MLTENNKSNAKHNEITNRQNENWCKTENFKCFYK